MSRTRQICVLAGMLAGGHVLGGCAPPSKFVFGSAQSANLRACYDVQNAWQRNECLDRALTPYSDYKYRRDVELENSGCRNGSAIPARDCTDR